MPQLVIDSKSYTPINFVRSAVFIAKEYFHRRPDAGYACEFVDDEKRTEAARYQQILGRDGIVTIPSYFRGEQLARLQAAFEETLHHEKKKFVPDSIVNEDILPIDSVIIDAALDNFLLQIIGGYYGKKFALGLASSGRLLTTEPGRYSSYQWHHDTRGKQVHLMILLSDTSEQGQRMSYLRGSHHQYYDRFRGLGDGSRFEHDVSDRAQRENQAIELVGPAGTVGLFDSNGLHSGNRNAKERRDSMLFCYVSKPRHFKPVSCRRTDYESLKPSKRELLAYNSRLTLVD